VKAAARDFWARAVDALRVAEHDLELSPDAAASRAYYAAFYAVSAHFALEGKSYTKHSAVEAAVHRDLVKTGIWDMDLGRGYSRLAQLRTRGDYGGRPARVRGRGRRGDPYGFSNPAQNRGRPPGGLSLRAAGETELTFFTLTPQPDVVDSPQAEIFDLPL